METVIEQRSLGLTLLQLDQESFLAFFHDGVN